MLELKAELRVGVFYSVDETVIFPFRLGVDCIARIARCGLALDGIIYVYWGEDEPSNLEGRSCMSKALKVSAIALTISMAWPYNCMLLTPDEVKQGEQYEHITLTGSSGTVPDRAISVMDLINAPARYDRKKVIVQGILFLEFEGVSLCDGRKEPSRCIALSADDGPYETEEDFERYSIRMARLEKFKVIV
jgi:hypothetical protein